jgi:2-octaprenyl-6-methoxyphenol hydroxylase
VANQEIDVDVLIVGGGLTGALLLIMLAEFGYKTLLVDTQSLSDRGHVDFDARSLALSPASQRILNTLHIWPSLHQYATAIETIHVSDQSHFGCARLKGNTHNPLGYVVEMQYLHQVVHQLLPQQHVMAPAQLQAFDLKQNLATIQHAAGCNQVRAQLVVAADGADSVMRQFCDLSTNVKDYQQSAIVVNIGLARSHGQCAYERFTANGPLALLPMSDKRMAAVWALPPKEAKRLIGLGDQDFLTQIQRAFGYRLGRFIKVGLRSMYPLRQVVMPQSITSSLVFIGNAAHTLHPVAGQGFNLGLRDVAMLLQCIAAHGLTSDMLKIYQKSRSYDQTAIAHMTDGLIELFTSKLPAAILGRGIGLMMVDNIPFLKNMLMRHASGFAGIIPDLVCGIPLQMEQLNA